MEHFIRSILYALYLVEYLSFYFVMYRYPFHRPKRWGWYLAGMVLVANLALWGCDKESVVGYFLIYGMVLLGLKLFYGAPYRRLLKEFILAFLTLSIFQSEIQILIGYFTGWEPFYVEVSAVLVVSVLLCGFYLLGGKKHQWALVIPDKIWWLVDVIFFVLVFMFEFYIYILNNIDLKPMVYGMMTVVTSVSAILICILIYALLIYDNHIRQSRMQTALLESFQEQQRQYFTEIMDKEYETRRFRHDILNDLLQLEQYSKDGENDRLAAYLEDMLGQVQCLSRCYDVGNDIVNTILNYYFTPLNGHCKITVSGYMKEKIEISPRDWCLLISNMIKNAAEAVTQVTKAEPEIVFQLHQGRDFLEIICANTYEGTIHITDNQKLRTTKPDKEQHGFGMETMQRIVDKYHGKCQISIENQMFQLDIFLKINRS